MSAGTKTFGFNVVGFSSGNLGLGVAARNVIDLIRRHRFPLAIVELDPGAGRGGAEPAYAGTRLSDDTALPYLVNLFVVAPHTLQELVRDRAAQFFGGAHLNAALTFWELPLLPLDAVRALNAMDVVVGVSTSMRSAYEFGLSGPFVISGRLPVVLPPGIVADRARFGLPVDGFVFATSFEPHSDPQRKNTLGSVNAFLDAFPAPGAGGGASFALRINNADTASASHPELSRLRAACAGHAHIHLVEGKLDYSEVLSLYASCDAFVSLHRAEGLGLAPLEAMLLGKPVIATAWSGNMTYMNHSNSCPVACRLAPLSGSVAAYQDDLVQEFSLWASPDLDDAARWMRRLAGDAAFAHAIGRRARASAARFNDDANQGAFVHEIVDIAEHLEPRTLKPPAERDSLFHAALKRRRDRINMLESRLQWIEGRRIYRLGQFIKKALGRR